MFVCVCVYMTIFFNTFIVSIFKKFKFLRNDKFNHINIIRTKTSWHWANFLAANSCPFYIEYNQLSFC